MNQETCKCITNNYAVCDNTVTELCHCKGVENYAKSLDVKLTLLKNLQGYYASVNSKHQHPPPPGDPRGFALYCCPGSGIYT